LQPGQTLTDDNLNKYPVSKDEQVDYSFLANNSASKLQSPHYAIPSRDLTSKRFSIVSAYAGYEPPPINLSLSKSQRESNEPVNREHACNSKFKTYPNLHLAAYAENGPNFAQSGGVTRLLSFKQRRKEQQLFEAVLVVQHLTA